MSRHGILGAREVTKALGGAWHGSYGTARCPVHDDRTPSLSISESQDGRLLVRCHAGCPQESVWEELRRRELLPGARRLGPNVKTQTRPRSTCPGPADDTAQRRTRAVRAIWQASVPAAGTSVETYLTTRGITVDIPPSIRFHPNLRHGPTGLHFEAMVAAVQGPDGEIVGVHRTYLLPGGRGKAQVTNPKLMLGPCCGGAVRFARAEREMAISEGIESGLSVLQVRSGLPVWAALSTSGLKAVWLPAEVESVVILADGDEAGDQAAQTAAQRLTAQGRRVRIARPSMGLDFNDELMRPGNVVPFPGLEAAHG